MLLLSKLFRLVDNFAALLAGANHLAIDFFMCNAGCFGACRANQHNLASVHGHFLYQDTALGSLLVGFRVTLNFVNAFHNNLTVLGHSSDNLALLAFIFAGQYHDRIALLYVHLNECQNRTSSQLKYFRSQGNDLHEVFIAKFSSYRSEDTRTFRSLVFFDDNCGVFIETDIGTVCAAQAFYTANDNCLNDIALLNRATRSSGFNLAYLR